MYGRFLVRLCSVRSAITFMVSPVSGAAPSASERPTMSASAVGKSTTHNCMVCGEPVSDPRAWAYRDYEPGTNKMIKEACWHGPMAR